MTIVNILTTYHSTGVRNCIAAKLLSSLQASQSHMAVASQKDGGQAKVAMYHSGFVHCLYS